MAENASFEQRSASAGGRSERVRQLWRLHIRPNGGAGDAWLATELCIRKGIIGMGWAVTPDQDKHSSDFAWYSRLAEQIYPQGNWSSVENLARNMRTGDLVWFRNPEGRYYAGEVVGPWQYCHEGEHIPADMINIRPARIMEVGLADSVPGKIIACFRPPRTLQTIVDQNMLLFTEHLLGLRSARAGLGDILNYLNNEDLENVVTIYLQTLGWFIVPGTRRVDTPHYEFVLIHRETGERGIVQVKSGNTPLSAMDYKGPVKTFLFAANGSYGDGVPDNVEPIQPDSIRSFMLTSKRFMPDAVKHWMEIASILK